MTTSSQPGDSTRIALLLQYCGSDYCGWQVQPGMRTVQGEVERAIASIVGTPTRVHCAGRTDTGVHASFQVAHFDVCSPIPAPRWPHVLNSRLPNDVFVLASASVDSSWHARFCALWRRYRYIVRVGEQFDSAISQYCWRRRVNALDLGTMRRALSAILGRHSLRALHRSGSSRLDSWVNVQDISCFSNGSFVIFEIQADGFLYGMVRLLVGLLMQVGEGTRSLDEFLDIVFSGRRDCVRHAAPACGLYLSGVGYGDSRVSGFYRSRSALDTSIWLAL